MRKVENIIIHHSASPFGTAHWIDQIHRGNGWSAIGYHFVILNQYPTHDDYVQKRSWNILDGNIETGRPLDKDPWMEDYEKGAHAKALGMNSKAIGICLIHDVDIELTAKQVTSLKRLVFKLGEIYDIPISNVLGHYEVDSNKPLCPGFDMKIFRDFMRIEYLT